MTEEYKKAVEDFHKRFDRGIQEVRDVAEELNLYLVAAPGHTGPKEILRLSTILWTLRDNIRMEEPRDTDLITDAYMPLEVIPNRISGKFVEYLKASFLPCLRDHAEQIMRQYEYLNDVPAKDAKVLSAYATFQDLIEAWEKDGYLEKMGQMVKVEADRQRLDKYRKPTVAADNSAQEKSKSLQAREREITAFARAARKGSFALDMLHSAKLPTKVVLRRRKDV